MTSTEIILLNVRDKQCKDCKAYRPRTKQQCNIWKHLIMDKAPDMVKNLDKFIGKDGMCKGYVWKEGK